MVFKRVIYTISSFILMNASVLAQSKCVDSFENKSLYNNAFKYLQSAISRPLTDNNFSSIYCASSILIKKDIDNNILWKKQIDKIADELFVTNDNSVLATFYHQPSGLQSVQQGFSKINSQGNVVWAKQIKSADNNLNNYGFIFNAVKGNNDDVIFSSVNGVSSHVNIVVLDSNASISKLNKTFKLSLEDGEFLKGIRTVCDSNNIYAAIILEKNTGSPKTITDYLLFLKIDYKTGILLSEVKYWFNDQVIYSDGVHENIFANSLLYENFNFKITDDNILVIAGRKSTNSFDNKRFFVLKCNKDFFILNHSIYKYPTVINFLHSEDVATLPYISTGGNILFSNIKDSSIVPLSTNNSYYFLIDTTLNLLVNRKQDITETGLNTDGDRLNVVPYLKNNNAGELIYHTNNSQHDSVLHIVNISKDINENDCMGKGSDVTIVIEKPAYDKLPPPGIFDIVSPALTLTSYTLLSQDEIIEERKFCKQISICDTIKLKGEKEHCLSDPFATFTVYKNPDCLRKIKWVIDTTIMKILATLNDSTINVEFLRPYHGYITATFEGCVLKDSMLINVYPVVPKLSLGNDTIFCPGHQIILNAGFGYKTYKWQDNSSEQMFKATSSGNYSVQVTDSCGNIFKDSVFIYAAPAFQLVYPTTLCRYDTASITLNNTFRNYKWSPSNSALVEQHILKLFPITTTLYDINAELFNGCILKDTLLVKVEICPESIYFPTAFTPNGDGKNDHFNPVVSGGSIKEYSFSIFNRFGQKVFNSQKINEGWDGKINGVYQDIGSYVWTCSYKFRNKGIEFKKGTVVLVR